MRLGLNSCPRIFKRQLTCSIFFIFFLCLFFVTTEAAAQLAIDAVYPTLGRMGQTLDVELIGAGFDAGTRVSMSLDSGNARAIIGSVEMPDNGSTRDMAIIGNKAYVVDLYGLQIISGQRPQP